MQPEIDRVTLAAHGYPTSTPVHSDPKRSGEHDRGNGANETLNSHRPEYLSIQQVGAATGLGRTFIYSAIKSGALTAIKAGRRTLIARLEMNDWLARCPRL